MVAISSRQVVSDGICARSKGLPVACGGLILALLMMTAAVGAADGESPASAADTITFDVLDLPEPATMMDLSEDGTLLVVSHQGADSVTVWDAAKRTLVKTLQTDSPRSVLCRGDSVFVANFGKGTVSHFSASKNWELVNQYDVHSPKVVQLSAGRSRMFGGKLLVTCHGGGAAGTAVLTVDTKNDKVTSHHDFASASMSCDGKMVLTQYGFSNSPSGGICIFPYAEFIGKSPKPITEGGTMQTPHVFQVHAGSYWIGDNIVFGGIPIKTIQEKLGDVIIPDHAQKLIYPLTKDRLEARRLDAKLSEVGSRKVEFPAGMNFEGVYHSVYRRRDYLLDHHIAWTQGRELRLFLLDHNKNQILTATTKAFVDFDKSKEAVEEEPPAISATPRTTPKAPTPSPSNGNKPSAAGTTEKELELPDKVVAGEKLSVQLKAETNAEFELMTGPSGMTVTKSGLLTWVPKDGQIGVQKLKIRVKEGKSIWFGRPSIEVIHKDVAEGAKSSKGAVAKFPRLEIDADHYVLTPGQDYRSLLLLQGDRLRVLDADGIKVKADFKLPNRYTWIKERPDHYVALTKQPAQLDLIHKTSHKVKKSIPIQPQGLRVMEALDLALRPGQPTSYVTIRHDIKVPSSRILVIDEASGTIQAPDDLIGSWVEVDPAGRYLYTAFKDIYTKGVHFHVNPDWRLIKTPDYGNIDWLMTYDLRGKLPKIHEIETNAGGNGQGLRLSPDGERIAYLSHVGSPMFSNNLIGWNPKKLAANPVTYQLKDRGITNKLAFHPSLKIVAVPGGSSAVLFDRETGAVLENRLQLLAEGLGEAKVEDLMFTPDGKSLLFLCNDGPEGQYLRQVGLRLSGDESKTATKGHVAVAVAPAPKPVQINRSEFDALKHPSDSKEINPKEISRRHLKSVVLVQSDRSSGTGFVVGRHGYILTCAHVIPPDQDVSVSYRVTAGDETQTITAKAEVLLEDDERDLALLKISTKSELHSVILAEEKNVELGEPTVVIGNPGLGDAILTETLTTGVVSSPARDIEGQSFIQTSAAVNPGNSGGPMFDSRGHVIGLVVMKGRIEATAFAVPARVLRQFLAPTK